MKIVHAKTDSIGKKNVFAADNVFDDMGEFGAPEDPAGEPDVAEEAEDLDPTDTELQQDSSAIEIDNNIANHLIAECENCHGIFISAMLASDQIIESINGICPLCSKDTEQTLKWIIKDYPE